MSLPEAKIIERRNITEELFVIKLKPEVEFKFKPGQYATLGSNGIERVVELELSSEENAGLENSANGVRELIEAMANAPKS